MKKKIIFEIISALAAVLILILAWLIAYYSVGNDYIVPSFSQSAAQFFLNFASGEFWLALAFTLLRTLASLAISYVLAAIFALISSVFEPFKSIFGIFMTVFRTLPTMAIALLLLIWSTPAFAPAAVCVLVLFPLIYARMNAAIEGLDGDLIEMAKAYKIPLNKRIFKIYLPGIAPNLLSQMGADAALSLKLIISAEVLCYTADCIGGALQQARLFAEMPRFAALLVAVITLGLILEKVFSLFSKMGSKWTKRGVQNEN